MNQTKDAPDGAIEVESRPSVVTEHGLIVDEDGQVIGHTDLQDGFSVNNEAGVDWVLNKIGQADAEIVRLKFLKSLLDARIKSAQNTRDFFVGRFSQDMERVTRGLLKTGKSYAYQNGTCGIRAVNKPTVQIEDPELALMYLEANCPEAVKVSKSVLVSKIDPLALNEAAGTFGIKVVEPHEVFTIKAFGGPNG